MFHFIFLVSTKSAGNHLCAEYETEECIKIVGKIGSYLAKLL
jgi:hypothetical protein